MKWLRDLLDLFFPLDPVVKDPPGMERLSPQSWIENKRMPEYLLSGYWRDPQYQVRLKKENLVPYLRDSLRQDPFATHVEITDTNSMDPVVDAEGNAVYIWGYTSGDHAILTDYLKAGDIAVYGTIMHRIIRVEIKSLDSLAGPVAGPGDAVIFVKHFRFLGDNNQGIEDPGAIPAHDIVAVVFQITY